MTGLRELAFGLLAAAIGLVLALATLEVAVRWMHLVPDRFWQPDPLLGVRLIPGKQGWWTQEEREFVVPVRVNSHGLRDVERPLEKPAGMHRILILGDSFVEAMHVPLEETFCRRLESLWNRRAETPARSRVEVVCAGVSGWGTASEVLWFENEGYRYQPDALLLAFYPGNDIKNNSPALEVTLRPQYDETGNLVRVTSTKRERTRPSWSDRFRLPAFLRQRLFMLFPGLQVALARLGLAPVPRRPLETAGEGYPLDYGVYAVPWSDVWQDAWQRTEGLLRRLREAAEQQGAQFAVVVIAGREQTDPTSWQKILEAYPAMKGRTWDLEAPQRAVLEWCKRAKIPCLELLSAFRAAHHDGGGPLHYPFDGHFTSEGHSVAAQAMVDFLVANSDVVLKKGLSHEDR